MEIQNANDKETGKDTVFHGLLHNDLPDSEKTIARLVQEAHLIIMAGQDATGMVTFPWLPFLYSVDKSTERDNPLALILSALTYELLAHPPALAKLKEALAIALPDQNESPTMNKVGQIPYLTAVLYETLRLHPPAAVPLTRVAPNEAIVYPTPPQTSKYIIPPGTPITMPYHLTMRDPKVFPNSNSWIPERWIDNPRLDRYILTFGRGTRMCLGLELAWQELYLVTAGVFRKYDRYDPTTAGKQVNHTLELYETRRERDVDMNADSIIIRLGKGSHGVRLRVR